MTAPMFLYRRGDTLAPADAHTADEIKRLPADTLLAADVRAPRNAKHHRLYWALCSVVADATGQTRDTINDIVKLRTGHCHVVKTRRGIVQVPKSISFAKMDQKAFDAFFERAVAALLEDFGIDGAATREILEMVG